MSTWFVNIDGDPAWLQYKEADATKIEKSFAKKAKSCMLNDTYKIDFITMRQVRRDDPDRWRAIKRGGAATDKPPKDPDADGDDGEDAKSSTAAKDDEEEDEPPVAAPAKAPSAPKAAAAAAAAPTKKAPPAKKGRVGGDDDDEARSIAETAVLPPVMTKKNLEPSSSIVSVSTSAVTERQLVSLRAQLGDLETELETSEAKFQAEMEKAVKGHQQALQVEQERYAKLKTQADTAINSSKSAAAEIAAAKSEVEKLKASMAGDKAKLQKADADAKQVASLKTELADSLSRYAFLIETIKPVVAAFGLDSKSPIGKAIAEYEKLVKTGKISPTQSSQPSAASSNIAGKKRTREDEEEEEAKSEHDSKKTKIVATPPRSPVAPRSPAARPAAATAAASSRLAVPAAMDDDDATQPMVGPGDAAADTDMTDADDGPAAASSSSPPKSTYLSAPSSLTPTAVRQSSAAAIPMCFARIPTRGNTSAGHLILVGNRGGSFELLDVNPKNGATKTVQLKHMPGRPAHRFAKPSAKTDDGEDYSQAPHVHCIAVIPSGANDTKFLLFAGEGRLFRTYELSFAQAHPAPSGEASLTFLEEIDVGAGSWVSALTRLTPNRPVNKLFVGVGISGQTHVVKMYSANPVSSPSNKLLLERTYPIRSDEVRGIAQLSDGRLVVHGCSSQLDGDLNEGGSVEIWSFDTDDEARGRSFLKHDLKVPSSIGLRCNSIRVFQSAKGEDQLLCAYEYCSNGARQLVLYTFTPMGMDVSALSIEPKNQPDARENTFTCVDVSPDATKGVAMTYGGRVIVYDLLNPKKLHTYDAHEESVNEEGTWLCLSKSSVDSSAVLMTMGGNKQISAWTSK